MYADIARRRLAQIRKSAFPAYAADRAHPLHSTNEADLLVGAEPVGRCNKALGTNRRGNTVGRGSRAISIKVSANN